MAQVFFYSLGDYLLRGDTGNEKGYFEDLGLLQINQPLLAVLGLVEHTARTLEPHWLDSRFVKQFEDRAADWLSDRLMKYPNYCMKDPRVTRLLPFWKRVFERLEISPKYLLAHRDPVVSAASLLKRGPNLMPNRALRSMLHHTATLLKLRGETLAVVDFDRLMREPVAIAREVAETLQLEVDESELGAYEEFISPSLNRSGRDSATIRNRFHPTLVKAAESCHQVLIQGTDPAKFWAEIEECITALEHLLREGNEDARGVLWVIQSGLDADGQFDEEAIAMGRECPMRVLVVHAGGQGLTETDQRRMELFSKAGIPNDIISAENAQDAAIKVKYYLEDVEGLFDTVRFPDQNGLGAYVRMAQNAGRHRRLKIRVDTVGSALEQLDESGILPSDTEPFIRDALERISRAPGPGNASDHPCPSVMPLISICIAHYNRPHFLKTAIEAVRGQTYKNIEILVLDDGSDDPEARRYVESLKKATREEQNFRVFLLKHRYLDAVRNVGARHAKGDFLLFVDDDNIPLPYAVEKLVACALRNKADVVTSASYYFSEDSMPTEPGLMTVFHPLGPDLGLAPFMNTFGDAQALYKTSWLREVAYTELGTVSYEDWEWFSRARLRGARFVLDPQPLYWYRVNASGMRVKGFDATSLRRVLQPFIDEAPEGYGNIVRYAQGLHFQRQTDQQSIQRLEQQNRQLSNLLLEQQPLFERDDPEVRETFMRATESADAGNLPSIETVVVIPEVAPECRARTRRRLRSTLASLAAQWLGGERVSVVDANEAPLEFGADSRPVRLYCAESSTATSATERKILLLNRVVEQSDADWIFPIYAGDTLEPDALYCLQEAVGRAPAPVLAYTDETVLKDEVERPGRSDRYPLFKSDFNSMKLRSHLYLGCSVAYRRAEAARLGGFRGRAWDYDMVLRLSEIGSATHVAQPLLNRCAPTRQEERQSESGEASNAMRPAALEALQAHLGRSGSEGTAEAGAQPGYYRVAYPAYGDRTGIVIWAHKDVVRTQASLEGLLSQLPLERIRLYIAYPADASEEIARFTGLLRTEGSAAALGVEIVGPVRTFDQIVEQVEVAQALFINEGAQLDGTRLFDAMAGLRRDCDAALFAPNILTSKDNQSIYHSAGCSPLLKIDEEEGRLFAGVSVEQPAIAEGFERLDLMDFWVGAPSFDAFGFVPSELDTIDTGLPVDAALPARLALALQKAGERFRTAHVAANVFVMPSEELQPSVGTEAYMPGSLSRSREAVYALLDGTDDPVGNRNLSRFADFQIEQEAAFRLGGPKRNVPRIIAHPADLEGCGEIRMISPMRTLQRHNLIEGGVTQYQMSLGAIAAIEPDTIVMERQYKDGQIERIRRIGACYPGIFKVFEIDDLLHQLSVHNPHRDQIPGDVLKRLRRAIELCDRLVVSSEPLAEAYGRFAQEVVVVHNTIEMAKWSRLRNQPRLDAAKPRVGWAGGVSHKADLVAIRAVFEQTARDIDWVFFGMCPDELRPYVAEVHAGVPIGSYPAKLASLNLNLAIAPLEHTTFNRAKSHLKVLEYGILGIPVIASDFLPYNHDPFPIELVNGTPGQWIEALRENLKDREVLRRKGERLRQYVIDHWSTESRIETWLSGWTPSSSSEVDKTAQTG